MSDNLAHYQRVLDECQLVVRSTIPFWVDSLECTTGCTFEYISLLVFPWYLNLCAISSMEEMAAMPLMHERCGSVNIRDLVDMRMEHCNSSGDEKVSIYRRAFLHVLVEEIFFIEWRPRFKGADWSSEDIQPHLSQAMSRPYWSYIKQCQLPIDFPSSETYTTSRVHTMMVTLTNVTDRRNEKTAPLTKSLRAWYNEKTDKIKTD